MNLSRPPHLSRQGFSLVEVLALIGVLVVLFIALIPTTVCGPLNAKVAGAAGGLRKISTAYLAMISGDRPRIINENTVHDAARHIAQYGDYNEADGWLIKSDPLVEEKLSGGKFPTQVADKPTVASHDGKWLVNKDFKAYPVSFAVANNTPANAPLTTPIMWTRGLKTDGTWTPSNKAKPSPFGSDYGLIMFRDGTVRQCKEDALAEDGGTLQDYKNPQNRTANILKAIHPDANVLESAGN